MTALLHQHETPPDKRSALLRGLLIISSLVVAAAFSSWGTSRLSWPLKLAELTLCVIAWEVSASLSVAAMRRWLGRERFERSAGPLILAMLMASLPAAAAMIAIFTLLGEKPVFYAAIYGEALLICLVLALARRGLTRPSLQVALLAPAEASASEEQAIGETATNAFLRKHAPALSGGLRALQAEDHYLRLYSEGGSVLILMRLRDAVAELGSGTGWQPHRSFWINLDASLSAEKEGTNWFVRVSSDLRIPVSRANVRALKDLIGHGRIGCPIPNAQIIASRFAQARTSEIPVEPTTPHKTAHEPSVSISKQDEGCANC